MEYESAHMLDLETFGSQSREVGICLNNLASVDWARAEAAEPTEAAESARTLALREARESLDIENAQEQLDSALLGFRLGNLGYYLLMTGALEEAEDRLTEAMARRSEAYANPFHPSLVGTTEWLAICLLIRAARGVNAGARRARAAALAKAHGLDLTKLEARAARLLAEPG